MGFLIETLGKIGERTASVDAEPKNTPIWGFADFVTKCGPVFAQTLGAIGNVAASGRGDVGSKIAETLDEIGNGNMPQPTGTPIWSFADFVKQCGPGFAQVLGAIGTGVASGHGDSIADTLDKIGRGEEIDVPGAGGNTIWSFADLVSQRGPEFAKVLEGIGFGAISGGFNINEKLDAMLDELGKGGDIGKFAPSGQPIWSFADLVSQNGPMFAKTLEGIGFGIMDKNIDPKDIGKMLEQVGTSIGAVGGFGTGHDDTAWSLEDAISNAASVAGEAGFDGAAGTQEQGREQETTTEATHEGASDDGPEF